MGKGREVMVEWWYMVGERGGWGIEVCTFFMFSAKRSYSSRTSCSVGVSSGGELRRGFGCVCCSI